MKIVSALKISESAEVSSINSALAKHSEVTEKASEGVRDELSIVERGGT